MLRSEWTMPNMQARSKHGGWMSLQHGFTLIEVMVTVAVIAILAAVAYPSYSEYVRRGQLQEAFAAMADYRVKLEQYFQDHKGYGTTPGGKCADASDAPPWSNFDPPNRKFFRYECTVNA